jgi:sulfate permease, SulP family
MIMVSINTFSWKSLTALRSNPWQSSLVMLATVATVVATADLSKGVLIGVLLSGIFFAGKVARLSRIASELSDDGTIRTYFVEGQVFFASAGTFADSIACLEDRDRRYKGAFLGHLRYRRSRPRRDESAAISAFD